ncbi:hypothetical protein [Polyangium aurulentum]|uniref:hypothetical protein n=1 Tax=Polyangium aurulentum TaxID=2567896 RepID=UPI0010ADC931|nr:hypothetical protein [Polyangium aurulentum]UQA61950.1 hypothetical protein E8A73_016345 [Polyangium aurulentum]
MRKPLLPLAALLVVACGSSSSEPANTPADEGQKPATATRATPEAATAFELTPVPEPDDVVGVMAWKNPAATIGAIADCAKIDRKISDEVLRRAPHELVREILPRGAKTTALAEVMAVDAPVFGIVTLESNKKAPGVLAAVSFGLTSLEKARAAAEEASGPLTESGPGMWRMGGKSDATCMIAASAGAAPARLVCGIKGADVTALTPYLTRTLPTAAGSANDLHIEARLAPVEARFGPMIRSQLQVLPVLARGELANGDPKFDRAIVDAASAIADEAAALVGDADRLSLDVSVDPTSCLRASGSLALRAQTSWLAQGMAERPDRAGPAPAIFWRAPKDSGSVAYGRGSDPARFTPILRNLRMMLDGLLTKHNVGSAADRKALTDLIDLPMGKDVVTVSASGRLDLPAPAGDKRTPQQEVDAILNSYVGWSVIGYEEGSGPVAKQLKDIASVYNRKGLQDPLKKALGKDAVFIPTIKAGAAPGGLGADSIDLEIKLANVKAADLKLAGATAKDKVNAELHVMLMPDGKDRTWLAIGTKRDELVKRLLVVKTGAPDAGTIASRTDLEPLRTGKHMSAGFFTFGPIVKGLDRPGGIMGGKKDPMLDKMIRSLGALPNRGESPMFFNTTVAGGDAPRGDMSVWVPRPVLEDLGALLKAFVPSSKP